MNSDGCEGYSVRVLQAKLGSSTIAPAVVWNSVGKVMKLVTMYVCSQRLGLISN